MVSNMKAKININEYQCRMKLLSDESTRYMQALGYEVEQRNGQRHSIYVGNYNHQMDFNNNNNQYGHKEREVFVGKIPRDMFEKDLFPHLSRAGKIVHLRIMMDFSGTTRGFGFVKYSTPQEAKLAVTFLNNTVVRQGDHPIGVVESFDNKRLYFGNLPINIDEDSLLRELRKVLDGVVSVDLPECSTIQDSRHAFVQFRTHDDATQARRILVPGDPIIFDRIIRVDWAKPERSNSILSTPSPISSNNSSINEKINYRIAKTDAFIYNHNYNNNTKYYNQLYSFWHQNNQ